MEAQENLQMTINKENDIADVIDSLKEVEIVDYPEAKPYRDATIILEEIPLSTLQPIALYVVRRALARQFALRSCLLRHDYDTLHLNSGLSITYEDTTVNLTPPIVEETNEGLCLVDGLHRSMMAHSIGQTMIRVLHITNIDPNYPLTSYPNRWDEVQMYDTTPVDRTLKRNYRSGSHFFRDLSNINGSKRREGGDAT